MKYFKFWNQFTESFHDGYFIKEDERYIYLCSPLFFEVLNKFSKINDVEDGLFYAYDKGDFLFLENNNPPKFEEWFFSFPYENLDVNHIFKACLFFEYFNYYKDAKNNITSSFEKTILDTRSVIPPDFLSQLVRFTFEHFKKNEERFNLLYSSIIQSYLN